MKQKITLLTMVSALLSAPAMPVLATEKDDHEHAAEAQEQTHQADQGEQEHDHEAGGEAHEEGASAKLSMAQLKMANIEVKRLQPQVIDFQVYAPAEIQSNGYTSYLVSPRVDSVVIKRHVTLGQHVKQGQPLVTLFSAEVAEAQAQYKVARSEWQRVQRLGLKTVGEQRFVSAKADFQAALAKLQAYGLEQNEIESLSQNKSITLGQYTLTAHIEGAVLSDDFAQGQRVEAGEPLIDLADEKSLWVNANLPADRSFSLHKGSRAVVVVGDIRVEAKVIQEAHTIDEQTRTRTVRLLVNNAGHRLHPGQFAEVYFQFKTEQPVLAVPETALMRSADSDWTVFVEDHAGEYKAVEVELGQSFGNLREIKGIAAGQSVVWQGAFFVASEIAKGDFDIHNH